MKFKSSVYTQVSGSVGGLTYAHNQGGMYARARSIPVDPSTGLQAVVRNAVASLASAWSQTLTAAQQAAWSLYAANVPLVDAFGDQFHAGGMQHYIRSNVPRLQAGLDVVNDGPTIFNYPTPNPATLYSFAEATDLIIVSVVAGDPWAGEDDAAMLVYQGYPQLPTRNFYKGPYRYVGALLGDSVTPLSGPQPQAAKFPASLGDAIFGYVRITMADGRLSTPRRFRTLAA